LTARNNTEKKNEKPQAAGQPVVLTTSIFRQRFHLRGFINKLLFNACSTMFLKASRFEFDIQLSLNTEQRILFESTQEEKTPLKFIN
jgi:hypothetical protein